MNKTIQLDLISTLPTKKEKKSDAEKENQNLIQSLSNLQDKFFAQHKYSLLIIFQGMDTEGKDSAVKHVFTGVNPAGCSVKSFKVPTIEEYDHHFLWRVVSQCPAIGMFQIFNRSHYEAVLMPRISHQLTNKALKQRCKEINVFEQGLINNNTIILKFYLHISHKEQNQRLKERQSDVTKIWKFQKQDLVDVKKHNAYKEAYEFIFKNCANAAPWRIIPADKKWHKNNLILNTIVSELSKYKIEYPIKSQKINTV